VVLTNRHRAYWASEVIYLTQEMEKSKTYPNQSKLLLSIDVLWVLEHLLVKLTLQERLVRIKRGFSFNGT